MSSPTDPQRAVLAKLYPEIAAGGYSRVDGTVEFFTRVNALLAPDMTVVDFGAGRGEWVDDPISYRRELRTLRGKVREVIGVDIDDALYANPTVDRHVLAESLTKIPLETGSVDLIVSDNTFEHIDNPQEISREIARVLRPGGWLCARTPNRWGYIALAASMVPNRGHVTALRRLQPGRKAVDVFPTRYRLNSAKALRTYFPKAEFESFSYFWSGEPGYFGRSTLAARAVNVASRSVPSRLKPKLMVFLRRK